MSEFYSTFIKPPLTKRTEEWTYSVYIKLLALEEETKGITLKSLSEKPLFITTFMQALQIALRNHQEEKLEALRNAVINTARPTFPEDDIYLTFLNWIDVFTNWHILVLNYLNERELEIKDGSMPMRNISIRPIDKVLSNFPLLRGEREFALQLLRDLSDRGLVSLDSAPSVIRSDGNFYESYTTDLGKRFMQYINS